MTFSAPRPRPAPGTNSAVILWLRSRRRLFIIVFVTWWPREASCCPESRGVNGRPPPGPRDGAVTGGGRRHAGRTLSRGSPGILGVRGRPAPGLPPTLPPACLATRAREAAAVTVFREAPSADAGPETLPTRPCPGRLGRCFCRRLLGKTTPEPRVDPRGARGWRPTAARAGRGTELIPRSPGRDRVARSPRAEVLYGQNELELSLRTPHSPAPRLRAESLDTETFSPLNSHRKAGAARNAPASSGRCCRAGSVLFHHVGSRPPPRRGRGAAGSRGASRRSETAALLLRTRRVKEGSFPAMAGREARGGAGQEEGRVGNLVVEGRSWGPPVREQRGPARAWPAPPPLCGLSLGALGDPDGSGSSGRAPRPPPQRNDTSSNSSRTAKSPAEATWAV